jgi:hypothetical protein
LGVVCVVGVDGEESGEVLQPWCVKVGLNCMLSLSQCYLPLQLLLLALPWERTEDFCVCSLGFVLPMLQIGWDKGQTARDFWPEAWRRLGRLMKNEKKQRRAKKSSLEASTTTYLALLQTKNTRFGDLCKAKLLRFDPNCTFACLHPFLTKSS